MKRLESRGCNLGLDEVVESSSEMRSRVKLMQISPKHDEKRDKMELYLVNFERHVVMACVPKAE